MTSESYLYDMQIRLESPSYPSTKLALRLPSLQIHFSPARYHRLMQIVKIFQEEDSEKSNLVRPWENADFEGWLSLLTRKVALHPSISFFLCARMLFNILVIF